MVQTNFQFPQNFLWGTATSSHQVEGSNENNNWWAWENQSGRIMRGHRSGRACDWWGGRWAEDFDRAANTYQNSHRLSLEWSRIQPTPQKWDEDNLAYYRQMLHGLRKRGLTPMVTLHHFSDPLWIMERGGWENESIVEAFRVYTLKVVEALKDETSLWITINEPNVYAAFGYVMGSFPPGKRSIRSAYRVLTNMLRAHAAAYEVIHVLQPEARVGFALHYQRFKPANPRSPLDCWATNLQSKMFNESFLCALSDGVFRFGVWNKKLPQVKGTQDFIGLNYYTTSLVAFDLLKAGELFGRRFFPPGAPLSETGYIACVPQGFYEALDWVHSFHLPIWVTENGVEDSKDQLRPHYLSSHIEEMRRAMQAGMPIQGYYYWSLVDNFEWERGWTQRFGLWELDVETQERRKRPSADLYADICRGRTG